MIVRAAKAQRDGFPATVEVMRAGDHARRVYSPELAADVVEHESGRCTCSNCGRALRRVYLLTPRGYRYCPGCGARIEVER